MNEQIELNVFYPHPVEKVWQALTDRRILNAWMMNNDFEPRVGHKFRFESELPGIKTTIHCEVVELEPFKRLIYTWRDEITSEPTLVVWTLTGVENGTQLQLKHLQTGYVTALVGESNNSRQIGNGDYPSGTLCDRVGSFFYEKPIANLKEQMLLTILDDGITTNKFSFLPNHQDSKEQWNYRLNHQLLETLEQDCSCF